MMMMITNGSEGNVTGTTSPLQGEKVPILNDNRPRLVLRMYPFIDITTAAAAATILIEP